MNRELVASAWWGVFGTRFFLLKFRILRSAEWRKYPWTIPKIRDTPTPAAIASRNAGECDLQFFVLAKIFGRYIFDWRDALRLYENKYDTFLIDLRFFRNKISKFCSQQLIYYFIFYFFLQIISGLNLIDQIWK